MAGLQERKLNKTQMQERGWRLVHVDGQFREEWHSSQERKTSYCFTPVSERGTVPGTTTETQAVRATA